MSNQPDRLESTTTTFIDGLRQNQPVAIQRLRTNYAPVILKLCLDGCEDRQDAESVAEEVIRVVLTRVIDFDRKKGRFRNYVKKVTFSKISDFNRKRKALNNRLQREDFMAQFDRLHLRRVISELKNKTNIHNQSWEMFFLHYRDKKTISEIASSFGITEESVKRTLRRIRKEIRGELDR